LNINDSLKTVTVKIINNSGKKIPAIPDGGHPTYLTYHIYDSSGKLINWDNLRTPLETDIYASIVQGLNISTNQLKNHKFIIEIDLVTENIRWWGINSQTSLFVN